MEVQLSVATKAGASVVSKLAGAKLTRIRWALNEPESWAFEIDPHDPQAALIPTGPLDANEVQLWIDGVLKGWGPVVRRDKHTVQCVGCRWFAAHRFLGPVYSFMSSYDGSFEATTPGNLPTGWISDNLDFGEVINNFGNHGNHALGVRNAPSPDDGYAGLLFAINEADDYEIEVSAWQQNGTGISVVESEDQGLVLVLWANPAVNQLLVVYGAFEGSDKPEFLRWRRKSAKITVPAGPHLLDIRLYAPSVPSGIDVYWDDLEVRLDQRTYSTEAEDASALIRRLVEYCTGVWVGGGPGDTSTDFVFKSDLFIDWNPANTSSVGRIGARSFDHSDHPSFEDCLKEFPSRNLCDMEVTYSSSLLTRLWTIYAPRKGTDRTNMGFTLDGGTGNIVAYDYLADGLQTANQVRVPGPGRAGSESGLATGTGTLVEMILPAVNETDLNAVDAIATADLARRQAGTVPWIDVSGIGALLTAGLTTGDTIHPRITDGWVNTTGNYRVMAIEITDPGSDVGRLTLNLA